MKHTIVIIFSVQFSGVKYIHAVQPISRTLFILHNWNYIHETTAIPSHSTLWQLPFYFVYESD